MHIAFSSLYIKTSQWIVCLLSVYVIGSPAGKCLFASPVCRAQRLLYQGEDGSRPETGCSGSRNATSERGLEREQWKTWRGVKETRGEGEHIQASSCGLPYMTLNLIELMFEFTSCCCSLLHRSAVGTSTSTAWKRSARRSRSRIEKNSSGLRRSSDIWLTSRPWKTTRPSTKRYCSLWWSANKTKAFFSCGFRTVAHNAQLEMLLLYFIARHHYSIHCTHTSHIWSYCILYPKIT